MEYLLKDHPQDWCQKKYIVDGENIRASWKDYFMAEYPQNEIRWTMENSLIEMFRMEQQNYAKIFGWQWQKSWRWTHCLMVVRAGLPVAAYCRINGHGGFVYRSDMPFCMPFFLLCASLSPLILYLSGPRSCAVVLRSRFMHCYAYYFLPRGKTRLHGWIIFLVPLNREPSLLFPKWFSFLLHFCIFFRHITVVSSYLK